MNGMNILWIRSWDSTVDKFSKERISFNNDGNQKNKLSFGPVLAILRRFFAALRRFWALKDGNRLPGRRMINIWLFDPTRHSSVGRTICISTRRNKHVMDSILGL